MLLFTEPKAKGLCGSFLSKFYIKQKHQRQLHIIMLSNYNIILVAHITMHVCHATLKINARACSYRHLDYDYTNISTSTFTPLTMISKSLGNVSVSSLDSFHPSYLARIRMNCFDEAIALGFKEENI